MAILKKDNQIDLADLLRFPVWEFALTEIRKQSLSERTMKPSKRKPPYDPHKARILVRASFKLRDGTIFKGHIKPIDSLDTFMGHISPIDLFPVILTDKGSIIFWYGPDKPSDQEIVGNYNLLGKKSEDVFPITFQSDVDIINGVSHGVLDGFLYCIEYEVEDFFHMKESDIKAIR